MRHPTDIRDAAEAIASLRASEQAGPCPHCGGRLEVSLIDVTQFGNRVPHFTPSDSGRCVAECWRRDPVAYLASLGLDENS